MKEKQERQCGMKKVVGIDLVAIIWDFIDKNQFSARLIANLGAIKCMEM